MYDEKTQICIKACLECYKMCIEMSRHCLRMGGKHADAEHIQLLEDCANICRTSAEMMLRQSPYQTDICTLCAKVCEDCAVDCERFDDEFMKQCAEVCRRCAESCKEMLEMKM